MTQLYSSDNSSTGFDATTAGTLPSGWASAVGTWAAEGTLPLAGHTHTLASTTQHDGDVALFTGASATADMEILFAQQVNVSSGNTRSVGAILRSDSANNNHYAFLPAGYTAGAQTINVYKKVAGVYTLVAGHSVTIALSTGSTLCLRAQCVGTTIQFRVWLAGNAEPSTWDWTATDSSVTAAGYAGVYNSLEGSSGVTTGVSDLVISSIASGTLLTTASPATATAGAPLVLSGAYSGTAPPALNYSLDGGSYAAITSPTISGGAWSGSIVAPSAGYHTVSVQESSNTAITGAAIVVATGSGLTTIDPSNSAIVYSPYNWNVQAGSAATINSGAYFRTLFTGTTCDLTFNISNMGTPASEIWCRIDNGPWTQYNVASTVALTIPSATLSNADVPYHLLEVVVKSTTETQNRWNVPSATAVVLVGISLDSGALVASPGTASPHLLIYGDSITEGVRTLGESATNDTDRNDATQCWSLELGRLLGAEVGVVGFGATGLVTAGSGNVPALTGSWNYLYSGVSRTFSPAPDVVIFNEGTNDGSVNTVSAMTTVLNGILSACPTSKVVVLRPFNGNQAANLQSAIAACNNPKACYYVDTTGFFNTAYGTDSLDLHPSGPNSKGIIAPQVATAVRTALKALAPGLMPISFIIC